MRRPVCLVLGAVLALPPQAGLAQVIVPETVTVPAETVTKPEPVLQAQPIPMAPNYALRGESSVIRVYPDGDLSLQQAVDRAGPGTDVVVAPGNYGGFVMRTSGLDRAPIRVMAEQPGTVNIMGGIAGFGVRNIHIQGFTVSSLGNGIHFGASGTAATINDPSRQPRNLLIIDNTIARAGEDGIKISQCDSCHVLHNRLLSTGTSLNGNGDGGIDFVNVNGSHVVGNVIGAVGKSGSFGHTCMMLKGGSAGNFVAGNRFLGCTRAGMSVGGWTDVEWIRGGQQGYEARGNTVTGNVFNGGSQCAIILAEAYQNTITNNQLTGMNCIGLNKENDNNTIENNGEGASPDRGTQAVEGDKMNTAMKGAQVLALAVGIILSLIATATGQYATEPTQLLNYGTLLKQVAEAVRQTQYWKTMLEGLSMNNANDVLRAMQLTQQGLGQVQGVWYNAARLEEQLTKVHYENLPADMDPRAVQQRYLEVRNSTANTIKEAFNVTVMAKQAMQVTEQVIAMGGNASANASGVRGAIQAGNQVLAGIGGALQSAAAMDVAQYRMQTERAQREETERRLAIQQRDHANRGFYEPVGQEPFGTFGYGQPKGQVNGPIIWENNQPAPQAAR